jgi:hypothetical protein
MGTDADANGALFRHDLASGIIVFALPRHITLNEPYFYFVLHSQMIRRILISGAFQLCTSFLFLILYSEPRIYF